MGAVRCLNSAAAPAPSSREEAGLKAFAALRPASEPPRSVQTLKDSPKSSVLRLVFPAGFTIIAKRCTQETAALESTIYREVLPESPLFSLKFYGTTPDEDLSYAWIFLEDAGEASYLPDCFEHRVMAARWLAAMHGSARYSRAAAVLPECSPQYYLSCLKSGSKRIADAIGSSSLRRSEEIAVRRTLPVCEFAETQWHKITEFCEAFPKTLVHGDFVPKNLRLRESADGLVLMPLDWEHAGWGPPAVDLHSDLFDIDSYWSLLRELWPDINDDDLARLRLYGRMFRLAAGIDWISHDFVGSTTARSESTLDYYRDALESAARQAQRGWND
jgi:Phosphotransferase enzyme family